MRRELVGIAAGLIILLNVARTPGALSVPVIIKECTGAVVSNWPVTAVVPLPYGEYTNTDSFVLRAEDGTAVPAQFDVLNRWVGRDGSLRHVTVQFFASAPAYTGTGTGTNIYFLRDNGPAEFSSPLSVSNLSNEIIVHTGPLRFSVNKHAFNLLDGVWLDADGNGVFDGSEQVLNNTTNHGAVLMDRMGEARFDAHRTNLTFTVEESGPLRVVIRVSSPTVFNNTNDHTHGFAVRIYAYAGCPYLKLDYQLQNAALNTDLSWPLYFESCRLDFALAITGAAEMAVGLGDSGVWSATTNAARLAQAWHSTGELYTASSAPILHTNQLEGWVTLRNGDSGIGVFLRNFWQTWPNGIAYSNSGALSIELFPEWSCQFFATNNIGQKNFTDTGLYWLEDMQATCRELVLWFQSNRVDSAEAARFSAHLEHPPVPVIPLDWYRTTHATLDLEGYIPPGTPADADTERLPTYSAYDWTTDGNYRFNWDNYYLDEPIRKYGTATTGGWPGSAGSLFIATGNPAHYYDAERKALAELNMRPHWLPGYDHERDFDRLRLTTAPYSGQSWRRFDGHSYPWLAAPYLDRTALDACPRDDQHGWYQHMRDWYHVTANPWARDWYTFIDQFRYTSLLRTSPYEDLSGRARGHSLAHALAAFRATGNTNILRHFATEVRALRRDQFQHGGRYDADKDGAPAAASWQAGYVSRAVLDYMNEVEGTRDREWAEAFSFIAGLIDWNMSHANFSYYLNAFTATNTPSSSTGLILVDLQSWYALATGDSNALRQTMLYVTNGIFGGETPAGDFSRWTGQYEARQWSALTQAVAAGRAFSPPQAIPVFSATAETGRIVFRWQGMPGATRYHVCWSTNEISLTHTLNTNYINWWAAETTLTNRTTSGGESITLSVTSAVPAGAPISACIFYFDTNSNMSVKTEIVRPPTASFAGIPLRGAAPLTVSFSNQTPGTITSSRWSFGDGAVSNTTHADHTYTSAGDYDVSLTVANSAGTDTLSRAAYIHVVPEGMPIADLHWSTNRGPAPLTVQFTNCSIGAVFLNQWDFGDGETSTLSNPEHTFSTAGTYTVTLIAQAAAGSDTCRVENAIEALPPPPSVSFSAHPVSGGFPLEVQFTNTTTGIATNWSWNFGDGGFSSLRDPQYVYTVTGTYTVILMAGGPGGTSTNTRTDYITVLPESGRDYYPASGIDDANQEGATMMVSYPYLYLAYSRDMLAGFRFTGIEIPPSSVVTRAYIQFCSTTERSDPAEAFIRAEKNAAPASFATNANNLSARTLTDASVSWTLPAWGCNELSGAERTPDISTLVRELIASSAWTNRGAMAFVFSSTGNYGEQGMRHAWSYENAAEQNRPEYLPRLHIEVQTNVNFAAFSLRATALSNSVMLRWTDPARCGAPGWSALIRADTNAYPAAPTSGVRVASTTNGWALESGVDSGVTRYYTLWLSPDGTNWLEPNNTLIFAH